LFNVFKYFLNKIVKYFCKLLNINNLLYLLKSVKLITPDDIESLFLKGFKTKMLSALQFLFSLFL